MVFSYLFYNNKLRDAGGHAIVSWTIHQTVKNEPCPSPLAKSIWHCYKIAPSSIHSQDIHSQIGRLPRRN